MDAYSEVLLGYYISDSENYEAQYHAYRMAIQISGHKPYEIVYDNQGGHKKLENNDFFDKICHIHRPTAPYSGQSKTIESAFGRFQSQELNKDWRFTGMNVTTKKLSSRPNLEFVSENDDRLFTLEELKTHYAEARKAWNEAKHPATGIPRIEMYKNSVNEETEVVTIHDMIDIFWLWTKRPATFTDSGIEVTIDKKKIPYEVFAEPGVPDHEWRRRNTYRKFYVKYDPYDTTSVQLYWKDKAGGLRKDRVAELYKVVHRAIQDQKENEAEFIRRASGQYPRPDRAAGKGQGDRIRQRGRPGTARVEYPETERRDSRGAASDRPPDEKIRTGSGGVPDRSRDQEGEPPYMGPAGGEQGYRYPQDGRETLRIMNCEL